MQKKMFGVVVAGAALVLSLGACGSQPQGEASADSGSAQASKEAAAATKDFDGTGQEEVGEGEAVLATAAGTTEDGNTPKITLSDPTSMMSVEVRTKDLDGAPVTYTYVDGVEVEKGNHGDSQYSVALEGDALKAGSHQVEVVQFEGDDPSGTVTFYRLLPYEIAE